MWSKDCSWVSGVSMSCNALFSLFLVSEQGRYVCKLYDSFGALAAIHDAEKWDALLASGNTVGVLLRPPKRDVKMFPFWLAKVVCRGYDKEKEESVKEQ